MSFSRTKLMDILADANEGQPELRQLKYDSLVAAAYRAEAVADSSEQALELIASFAAISTKTVHSIPSGFLASCSDLLPAGHSASDAPMQDRVSWVLVDPLLGPSRQALVAACISVDSSETENIHAWARINALSKQEALPQYLISTIAALEIEAIRG
jgi:hypothetical protein